MSFLSYMQSLWDASPSFSGRASRGGKGASAQQLGSGVWPLSAQVREEMKMGTRYNMKVVLRGTRATGKSTLMARLSGHSLPARYNPSTDLIASTMRLQGEHCAPHEGTKVDIWEVVEECRQQSSSSSSASASTRMAVNIPTAQLQEALRVAADARLLDVYAGCQLVIFMIDPRQRNSWEYAKQETLHVSPTTCILYALNFSDVGPFPAASGAVPLDEVELWCNRARRATTSFVHRMLEGRQAPPEYSVRPMTAVLSAQTGAGMLGVMRALHVASTLVRITAEEVRVQQLLTLLARQQAVSIADDTSSHALRADTAPLEGDCADQSQTLGKVPPGEELKPVTRIPAPPPSSFNASAESALKSAARSSLKDAVHALPHPYDPIAKAEVRTTPAWQSDSVGLRMQSRASTLAATAGNGGGCGNGDGKDSNSYQTLLAHPMSDAEAMRLFLGSSNSGASGQSSPNSSSSSPASAAAGSCGGAAAKRRSVTHRLDAPSAPLPVIRRGSEGQARSDSAAASSNANGTALAPPPLSEELHVSQLASQVVRPTKEEMVSSLVANMVHDVSVPADNFFTEEEGEEKDELSGAASGVDPATPIAAAQQFGDSGMRTVRMLKTQRVVQRASVRLPTRVTAPDPAFHADVSTILAQMTAALTAELPTATAERLADDAVDQCVTTPSSDLEGTPSAMRKKKTRHSNPGRSDARGRQRHHRKKLHAAANRDAMAAAVGAPEETDNGSFDLVFV
ncbi:hypothetical protein GH5_00674 [Leishmania sp. Ghana 2012 LV757]|uniref:hypothetical protein n=1 Tax=Leishmania sp. Ghana 2012 LV757 TaxID=2803181 RepID=UPI001B729A8F|nr:hypothetical protein GH5_00674 [Leishmania sp. Ghana 2012 LV757]